MKRHRVRLTLEEIDAVTEALVQSRHRPTDRKAFASAVAIFTRLSRSIER